jgi:Transposase IS4
MTESIHGLGKVVIMDSGFCVLDGLIALKEVGVYGSALIKKRKYWPKYIDGDAVIQHFDNKEVGSHDALKGEREGKSFYIYAMKEPNYVMMMMATYGTMKEEDDGNAKRTYTVNGVNTTKNFKYTTPFYNHFKFRHQVDDHNAKRHSPISVEETLGSRRWSVRQFTFLLALTEVNVKLGLTAYSNDETKMTMLRFRKKLAEALINNHWYTEEQRQEEIIRSPKSTRNRRNILHECLLRPAFSGKYDPSKRKFVKTNKKYSVLKCVRCRKDTRTYCRCNPAVAICRLCYAYHELEVEN